MSARLQIFVVVKGHEFSRDAFIEMLRAVGAEPTMVDQPAAATMLNPEAMRPYDAILFYDMPGMDFRAPVEDRPSFVDPPDELRKGFAALLASGKGMVALHHAIAGWPAWADYGKALGGRFLYKPLQDNGRDVPDSGYAPDARYTARIAASDHPVLDGVAQRFGLVDEPYRYELIDDPTRVPLLYLEPAEDKLSFLSAMRAVRRLPQEDTTGAPFDPLIGWAKAAGNSPLVYLQPGDSAATYANENYRRLVGNALRWVASADAREWARHRQEEVGATR